MPPLASGQWDGFLRRKALQGRQSTPEVDSGGSTSIPVIIGIIAVIVFFGSAVIAIGVRSARRDRNLSKKGLINFSFFRRGRSESNRGQYSAQLQPNESTTTAGIVGSDNASRERVVDQTRDVEMEFATSREPPTTSATSADVAGVDRNTSVRSVMTLPPYSQSARPTEKILGREGERAGIDVVVEFPETVDDEESRRDEEMESLYQIRRARRQEASDRERRRRERREARARGDSETLVRLQEESRRRAEIAADGLVESAQLIAEHQGKNRDRRISSVQYFDVGLARHDGSRVRAGSFESDNRPLLSSAASMASSSFHQDMMADVSRRRERSASSVLSVSTAASDESVGLSQQSPARIPPSDSAPDSGPGDFEVISLDNRSRDSSIGRRTAMRSETDVTDHGIPMEELPPQYDNVGWGDAPPYETPISPIRSTVPQLPTIIPIPSIEVTTEISPIVPSPSSPSTPQQWSPVRTSPSVPTTWRTPNDAR